MPLHLIKLCVGAESIADLEEWVAERVAERVRRGGAPRSQHVTRRVPSRAPELVDGGSLYWVIKGQLAARQRLLEIDGTAERLAACLRLLRREAALLDRMLVRSKDHAGTSSLN